MTALGRRRSVVVRDCRYAAWTCGKGPLVVLLHGWPVTSYHWRLVVPAFVRAGFSTLCVDLRGLGESVARADHRYAKKDLALDLLDVLARLDPQLESYSIIGHDWGGSIGVALAALDRRRVRALIVEEEVLPGSSVKIPKPGADYYPTWHGDFHRRRDGQRRDGQSHVAEDMVAGLEREYIEYFLRLRFDPRSLAPADLRTYSRAYRSNAAVRNGFEYYRTRAKDVRFFAALSRKPLELPVLALGGRYAMGPAVRDGLEELAKSVKGMVLPKSGHYPAEEEPKAFSRAAISFLKRIHL